MKIGIIGGTFDPPHFGHLIPVDQAVKELNLSEVLYMPAYIPPHKVSNQVTNPYHRTAMLALAIQHYPKYKLFPYELAKGKVSYTVETILELKSQLSSDHGIYFIIGTDSFLEIDTWHRYEDLIQLCNFIIINRGTTDTELNEKLKFLESTLQLNLKDRFHFVSNQIFPISSTEIRAAAASGESLKGLVPEEVANYIQRHGLYQRR
ncbi:MAG TPA: nicotinate (nicotinamide) nucleotide adenylyltransferase [Acidobacteriota bacterium]|nr:nicotinate (nicotinamide) nucleotide adenylyltransferase [Acidobacteriota bacterium]